MNKILSKIRSNPIFYISFFLLLLAVWLPDTEALSDIVSKILISLFAFIILISPTAINRLSVKIPVAVLLLIVCLGLIGAFSSSANAGSALLLFVLPLAVIVYVGLIILEHYRENRISQILSTMVFIISVGITVFGVYFAIAR